jgi:hypothetical protein
MSLLRRAAGNTLTVMGWYLVLAVALSLPYVLAHFDYTHWDVIGGLLVPSLDVAAVLALAVATPGRLRKPRLSPLSYEGMGRVENATPSDAASRWVRRRR